MKSSNMDIDSKMILIGFQIQSFDHCDKLAKIVGMCGVDTTHHTVLRM